MTVFELISQAHAAVVKQNSLAAVADWLRGLSGNTEAISEALQFVSGVAPNARQVFYRSPELTMLKVRFPVGRRTPPHDHGTWAAILMLSGAEKNTLYRRGADDQIGFASEVVLQPGDVLPMRADTAHVAECAGGEDAIGLHVYGGDILSLPRMMWHPQSCEPVPMEPEPYEQLAQLASGAQAAPRP